MILYDPANGDVHTKIIKYRPRTCFIMTWLKKPVPPEVVEIREKLSRLLKTKGIEEIDAQSIVTGRDFLMKIWEIIITVPLGIAILNKNMPPKTLSNIFYEIGLMQAYGKETLIVKTTNFRMPSDFIRTEYIEYDENFETEVNKFFDNFFGLADYFETVSDQMENNPLLAIDYLRRAYLISGDEVFRKKAKEIYDSSSIKGRAKNSVEMLLINWCLKRRERLCYPQRN